MFCVDAKRHGGVHCYGVESVVQDTYSSKKHVTRKPG